MPGHHLPARARRRRPLLPRGLLSRPARDRVRTEQRRRLVVHEHDGRRHGPVRRADRRRRLRVRGRAPAARGLTTRRSRSAGAPSPFGSRSAGPTTARSSTRRYGPTPASRWRSPGRRSTPRASPRPASGCSTSTSGPNWSIRSPPTTRRSRTSSGPIATARSATRRSAWSRSGAAAVPTCRSRAGRAQYEWEGLGPLRRAPRARRPRSGLRPDREQPDHAGGLSAPRHQRLARRLPGAPDRGRAGGLRRARPRRLRRPADRHALAARASRPHAGSRPAPARPARDGGDRAPAQLGRADGAGLGRGDDLPGVHAAVRSRGGPRG